MELIPELEAILNGYREFELLYEGSAAPACASLSAAKQTAAVKANRHWAKQIGWGCLNAGKAEAIEKLFKFLKFSSLPSEEALACAVAKYQGEKKFSATGILDKRTWDAMKVVKPLRFPQSWEVMFGGKKLGVLEKARPYMQCYIDGDDNCSRTRTADSVSGGVEIEFGFRITDYEAVKKAGFVDDKGVPQFRWIQAIETNRKLDQTTLTLIKKYSKYVDPNPVTGKFDKHPYYWNEKGEGSDTGLQVQTYINRVSSVTDLCYDLIFYDRPSRPLDEAKAGKRVFWNAEAAIVGVRPGKKNVILDAFTWGFDLIVNSGKTDIKLNGLNKGVRGGSAMFRKTLDTAIRAGQFPDHCFIGTGYSAAVTCK